MIGTDPYCRRSRRHRRALARLRRLPAAQSGVAAIEFAMVLPVMVLPVMLLMYLGMSEVTVGVNMDRKLTILSRTLADLTGRMSSVSNAEIDAIFGAGLTVLSPYRIEDVKMRISSVVVTEVDGVAQARVCWSDARNMTPRPADQAIAVPESFEATGTSFILAEVEKTYVPMIGHAITGNIDLRGETPWPVRNIAEVQRAGTSCL